MPELAVDATSSDKLDKRRIGSSSETSQTTAKAVSPALLITDTACARPVFTPRPPRRACATANARPMPLPVPVTTTSAA